MHSRTTKLTNVEYQECVAEAQTNVKKAADIQNKIRMLEEFIADLKQSNSYALQVGKVDQEWLNTWPHNLPGVEGNYVIYRCTSIHDTSAAPGREFIFAIPATEQSQVNENFHVVFSNEQMLKSYSLSHSLPLGSLVWNPEKNHWTLPGSYLSSFILYE